MLENQEVKTVIEKNCGRFPYSKLFLENPVLDKDIRVNDFYDLQNLLEIYDNFGLEIMQRDIRDGMNLSLQGKDYKRVDDLIEFYRRARKNLVEIFSDVTFKDGLKLEDILFIDTLRRHVFTSDLKIEGDENICKRPRYYVFGICRKGTQAITHLLRDIVTLSYVPARSEKVIDFFVGVPIKNRYRLTMENFSQFAKDNKSDQEIVDAYAIFKNRIKEQLGPEIDVRFGKVVEERYGWEDDEEKDKEALRKMGFDKEMIMMGGSASKNLHLLQDTLKNSLWGISYLGKSE